MSDKINTEKVFFSKNVISGIPWMIVSKFIMFFVYFGISVVIVRMLGPRKYGVFSLCKNIAAYLIPICALGLNSAILRFVPELAASTNKAGIKRLLSKIAIIQLLVCGLVFCAFIFLKPHLNSWFHVDFRYYLLITGVLIFGQVAKNYTNDTFTAFFKIKNVALISILQSIAIATGLYLFLRTNPDVGIALGVEGVVLVVSAGISLFMLVKYISGLNWRSPAYGIGKRRTLKLSSAMLLNSTARMLMLKYTEIFFLGIFFSPVLVGIYELGYSTPQMVVIFIPMAIQTMFTSAFSEAYSRDKECLPVLISSFYRIIIITALPITAFGVFFASRGIELVYGAEMSAAGPVAAAFCLIHMFPLISMPLSMALVAKEKVMNMFPLLLFQVAVNLLLDFMLIPRYGIKGAVIAVVGTFVLTIPVRLYVVARLVGGIYFPLKFFFKIAIPFFLLALVLFPLAGVLNLATYFLVAILYAFSGLLLIKVLGLLSEDDVKEFRILEIDKLNKVLTYFLKEK